MARPQQARGIAEVHIQSWRTTYEGIVPVAILAGLDLATRAEQWRSRLSEPQPKTCTLVAEDERDGIVGFAMGGPVRSDDLGADGELYAIYLYQHWQGKHVGGALFREVVGYLADEGFGSVGVWVLELNPSRGFYAALGGELFASKSVSFGDVELKEIGYRWPHIPVLADRLRKYSVQLKRCAGGESQGKE